MTVKGITIHNTGNSDSAQDIFNHLKLTGRRNLCHYLIDEREIINTWPEEEPASHTGKGYDFGNMNTIAIEICRSQSKEDLYMKAQRNAVSFIVSLMEKYGLNEQDIYFHMDFDQNSRCPHRILDLYGNKQFFIKEVLRKEL